MNNTPILEMKNITKEFPGVKALDNVSFAVKRGEIHCLVGENGAGKSTLMKILSGVYPHGQYDGDIIFNGETQQFRNIRDSENVGISIIYQELALIPDMSVYENIFLGHEISNGPLINWNETIKQSTAMLKKVNLDVNPAVQVKTLGVGKQQLVEIAKALSKDVQLLILDEPTSALNEDDVDNLLDLLRALRQQGVTCIMITHKLKEVMSVADTVTVIRDGQTICTIDAHTEELSEQIIIKNMVGRAIDNIYPKRDHQRSTEVVLEVDNWTVFDRTRGRNILKNVSFNLKKGEIIGFAGLMGSGRTELALSIFGNPENYTLVDGQIRLNGEPKKFNHPHDAIRAGIAYVSEDRKKNGLILTQDVRQNISLANLNELAHQTVIDENQEVNVANKYKDSLNIKTPNIDQTVGHLSGGNQQKVSLAKWLFVKPDILILDEPTRGIDVGAKFEIYTIMNQLVEQGLSIIMISSELPEVLGMSDRIYIVSAGEITGELPIEEATQERIMHLATRN
ncbi:MAG TPA: ATP-binding cassette domain-containing protein [Anaerolineae bacterium]|nr:ATP-binding cassette domain-containing protein [Anaerolineae bacterium]